MVNVFPDDTLSERHGAEEWRPLGGTLSVSGVVGNVSDRKYLGSYFSFAVSVGTFISVTKLIYKSVNLS